MNFSVVVPVYNEVDNLPGMHAALTSALRGLDYELVYVDDGSQDGSDRVLEEFAAQDFARTLVVQFRRNFGQTAAIAAGIDHASGEIIVLIDADLQEDPADIPLVLAKIEEGYDVVSGWRRERKDAFLTRTLPSRMANWLISTVTGVHLHDYGCTLKAYRTGGAAGVPSVWGDASLHPGLCRLGGRQDHRNPGHAPPACTRQDQVRPRAYPQGCAGSVHGEVPALVRRQADLPVRRCGQCPWSGSACSRCW